MAIPPDSNVARPGPIFYLFHSRFGHVEAQREPCQHRAGDKFYGGELQELLKQNGIKRLVIVGSSANVTVLYTATAAARMYEYEVVIPMDGTNARSIYEQEYTFDQFTVLASNANKRFQFTKLSMIGFK